MRDVAARWLLTRGIEQWEPGELDPAVVRAQIAAGEWSVVRRDDDGIAAALRLLWDDPFVWGDQPPVAGYVHGLVVDRQHGRGFGRAALDWAGEQVHSQGRRLLRLDCQEHNAQLRAHYGRLGFTEAGRSESEDPRWRPVVRLERAVALASPRRASSPRSA